MFGMAVNAAKVGKRNGIQLDFGASSVIYYAYQSRWGLRSDFLSRENYSTRLEIFRALFRFSL